MTSGLLVGLTFLSALGSGLIAGVFFAFSAFVMRGLARLPAGDGIAAMQSINVAAISPLFMTALLGTAASCLVLMVAVLVIGNAPCAGCLIAGALLYLVGTVLVTGVFNIPRNNALAALRTGDSESSSRWAQYVTEWTVWNHVRGAASLLAAASFTWALVAPC